jgi:hypothetical protein
MKDLMIWGDHVWGKKKVWGMRQVWGERVLVG